MLAPEKRERLLTAMVNVYAEQGEERGHAAERANGSSAIFAGAFAGMLSTEEEELVAAVNAALAEIVAAVSGAPAEEDRMQPPSAIVAALGGAEMTLCGEILAGRGEQWPSLLPGFAYLATVPYLGDEEALRLTERVREIVRRAAAADEARTGATPRRPGS